MKTTVMKQGAARFDACGQFLGHHLRELDASISPGLAKRLVTYATKRAKECGLFAMLQGWEVEVYTMDGDAAPADRSYGVKWVNPQGTEIELCRILTSGGWPVLDHRFAIES